MSISNNVFSAAIQWGDLKRFYSVTALISSKTFYKCFLPAVLGNGLFREKQLIIFLCKIINVSYMFFRNVLNVLQNPFNMIINAHFKSSVPFQKMVFETFPRTLDFVETLFYSFPHKTYKSEFCNSIASLPVFPVYLSPSTRLLGGRN